MFVMTHFQCPNCGSSVAPAFSLVKMVTCDSCGTTLFLSDAAAEMAGAQGVMHDTPTLFGLGQAIRLGAETYSIVGQARFSYGRGTWDEFCALSQGGEARWISVDEGDIVVQTEVPSSKWPRYEGYLKLGQRVLFAKNHFHVVEGSAAECIAVRGSFAEPLRVGETYMYFNLQGENGELLSVEMDGDQRSWFIGRWFDPFDVEVLS